MYIGELDNKQLISIALMIIFAMAAMFFMGYKYAYDKSIIYANEQIEELMDEFEIRYNTIINPDITLGNLPPLEIGGQNEE